MIQRLHNFYLTKVRTTLSEKFHYTNTHQIPRLEKIVINRGVGDASQNAKLLESLSGELTLLAGQAPVVKRAKKAIAGFQIRENMPIGLSVTLRGERMYAFYDRLVNLALPRIRDFQGINPKSFDGHGNFNLGLDEQLMFPELSYDAIDQIRGMDIAIVTTSRSDEEGLALLQEFGMLFRAGSPIL
jgi:large subunit ribosomal protein L5